MPADNSPQTKWRWSYSRSNLLASCPAAFSFSLTRARPRARVNLSALVGIAIHQAIAKEIDKWARGEPVSDTVAQTNAQKVIQSIWDDRRNSIIEIANGFEEKESRLVLFQRIAKNRLKRFFTMIWPQFSHMRHGLHEKMRKFQLDGIQIAVKVDLACWTLSDELAIVDWKTGGRDTGLRERVQLAVYSLWSHKQMGLSLDQIFPIIVRLKSGEIVRYQVVDADLEYVKEIIGSDIRLVSEYSQSREFPVSPEYNKCMSCPYLHKCSAGMNEVDFDASKER